MEYQTVLDPACSGYTVEPSNQRKGFMKCNPVYKTVQTFLRDRDMMDGIVVVSLSGGVDSMVLTTILQDIMGDRVLCVHINYGNRGEENTVEQRFLVEWCQSKNLTLLYRDTDGMLRNNTDRERYEEMSRNIRFETYTTVFKTYDVADPKKKFVFLGHHADDRVENVLTNLFNGRSLTNLGNLEPVSQNNGVLLCCPLLPFHKIKILDFARLYKVPYFKDTTPEWSRRGVMRNETLPHLRSRFGNIEAILLKAADESDTLRAIINKSVLDSLMESGRTTNKYHVADYVHYDLPFWKLFFGRACHEKGVSMPSHSSIQNFIDRLRTGNPGRVQLKLDFMVKIEEDFVVILMPKLKNNL